MLLDCLLAACSHGPWQCGIEELFAATKVFRPTPLQHIVRSLVIGGLGRALWNGSADWHALCSVHHVHQGRVVSVRGVVGVGAARRGGIGLLCAMEDPM